MGFIWARHRNEESKLVYLSLFQQRRSGVPNTRVFEWKLVCSLLQWSLGLKNRNWQLNSPSIDWCLRMNWTQEWTASSFDVAKTPSKPLDPIPSLSQWGLFLEFPTPEETSVSRLVTGSKVFIWYSRQSREVWNLDQNTWDFWCTTEMSFFHRREFTFAFVWILFCSYIFHGSSIFTLSLFLHRYHFVCHSLFGALFYNIFVNDLQ